MKKYFLSSIKIIAIFSLGILFFEYHAIAAVPRSTHETLTLDIQNSIEWSQHLIDEVNKGKKIDIKHANQELSQLQDWLEKMSFSYIQLAKQPQSETKEGHFIAIKTHQLNAESSVKAISIQLKNPKINYDEIKKLSNNIKLELEAADRSHKQELNEIEKM